MEEESFASEITKTMDENLEWFRKQLARYSKIPKSSLINNEIIEVRPLSAPSNQLYYMDFVYNSNPDAIEINYITPRTKTKFLDITIEFL